MSAKKLKSLIIIGALSGILSILSYLIIAFTSLPNSIVFFLAMLFPILGIVFIFSLKEFIDSIHPSFTNALSFILVVLHLLYVLFFSQPNWLCKLVLIQHCHKQMLKF